MSPEPTSYVTPISFEELHEAGRLSMPYADAYTEGYGPVGDPTERPPVDVDELEAFVEAWAAAGQTPADPLLPG